MCDIEEVDADSSYARILSMGRFFRESFTSASRTLKGQPG
jgi:hypothetical protein